MEHRIKQYSCFFGEALHLERFFLNSLFFPSTTHFDSINYYPEFPVSQKANRIKISVGFFLLFTNNKNNS